MSNMIPLDGATHVEVATASGGFTDYRRNGRGLIEVDNPQHRNWLKREGLAVPANEGGATAHMPGGYTCPAGHRNFFRTCGRCESKGDSSGDS